MKLNVRTSMTYRFTQYVSVFACVHVRIYACVCVRVYVFVCMYMCTYMCLYTCTHVYYLMYAFVMYKYMCVNIITLVVTLRQVCFCVTNFQHNSFMADFHS
jgi:hypothetical protein